MKKIIKLNESDLHNLILEAVEEVIRNGNGQEFRGLIKAINVPDKLYHTAPADRRYIIMQEGLTVSPIYREWWEAEDSPDDIMPELLFFSSKPGDYGDDDDDVWEIDTTKMNKDNFYIDPSDDMKDCFCTTDDAEPSCIKLVRPGKSFDEESAIEYYEELTGEQYRQVNEEILYHYSH